MVPARNGEVDPIDGDALTEAAGQRTRLEGKGVGHERFVGPVEASANRPAVRLQQAEEADARTPQVRLKPDPRTTSSGSSRTPRTIVRGVRL